MNAKANQPFPKKSYNKVGFKLFIINKIYNGRVSVNYAAKKQDVSRATIPFLLYKKIWCAISKGIRHEYTR